MTRVVLVLALLFSGASLAAQQPALPEPAPEMTPGEVQKLFDGYLLIQAQAALQLTDQQFSHFIPRLRTLQETRRRNQQERQRRLNELQRMTNPRNPQPADDSALKEQLAALQELETRAVAEAHRAYDALNEVLNVRQQARFRVLEEQIERRKLELLLRARQNQNRQNANRPNAVRPNRPPPK